jgi:hypothetical protein
MKTREELLKSPYYWEETVSRILADGGGSKEIAEEITDRIKEYDKIVRLDDVMPFNSDNGTLCILHKGTSNVDSKQVECLKGLTNKEIAELAKAFKDKA